MIVTNPRETGGSLYRSWSWEQMLTELGYEVDRVSAESRWTRPWRTIPQILDVAKGTTVPEALLWQPRTLLETLDQQPDGPPDLVVLQTLRVFSPALGTLPSRVVVDFVDELSASYSSRARSASRPRGVLLRLLAAAHARSERILDRTEFPCTAAGRADAVNLDCEWIPLLVQDEGARPLTERRRNFDVTFFGTLDYPPNIEALEWLASVPGRDRISVLVAGRSATDKVRDLCRDEGWTHVDDFPSVAWLAEQSTLAIAPLRTTNGIQCKILDSAAAGLPMVATSTAMRGFDESFPAVVEDDPKLFVQRIQDLLDDGPRRIELEAASRAHVVDMYSAQRWAPVVATLIGGSEPQPSEIVGSTWCETGGTPSNSSTAGATSIESTGSADKAA